MRMPVPRPAADVDVMVDEALANVAAVNTIEGIDVICTAGFSNRDAGVDVAVFVASACEVCNDNWPSGAIVGDTFPVDTTRLSLAGVAVTVSAAELRVPAVAA